MIVPTLCVGMPPGTLRVPLHKVTQSVTGCIPTQSVGTIMTDLAQISLKQTHR
jgi:hypothetical protein